MLSRNVAASVSLMACILSTFTSVSAAQTKNIITIPKVDGIKIDGDLSDWGSRGYHVDYMAGQRMDLLGLEDCGVKMRYAWDDKGLLVAVEVVDDQPQVDGDSVRIAIERPGEEKFYRFTVSMSSDANKPTRIETRRIAFGLQGKDTPGEAVMKVRPKGYVAEMRIALENLALEPKEGTIIEPEARIIDNDKDQPNETFLWRPQVVDTETRMRLMVLGTKASQPQTIDAMSETPMQKPTEWHVVVGGPAALAGKKVAIEAGGRKLAESKMEAAHGQSMADIRVPAIYGQGQLVATAAIDGQRADFQLDSADVARAAALQGMNMSFDSGSYCFSGVRFPKCDFENWALAEQLLGKYKVKITYYDANYTEVENANYPGRYGAVVEVTSEKGPKLTRYKTICRINTSERQWLMTTGGSLTMPHALGLDSRLVAEHSEELNTYVWDRMSNDNQGGSAIIMSALMEAQAKSVPFDKTYDWDWAFALDRQWWLGLKRKMLGLDKIYDKPFQCPQKVDGLNATVVHEGTLADAGMKADAAEKIDAVCREWAANSVPEFAVCVVRHGVIVLNKGYGMRDGRPMTADDRSWMASITKIMSSTLMMEFIDQGLVGQDERVDKYLPQFRDIKVRKPLTIRNLYNHTNGMQWVSGWDIDNDLEQRVAEFYPLLEVGKEYNYNGMGFAIGGKVMETISGESLPSLYKNHLLRPLGCSNTRIPDTAGGTVSTPLDMARFGQMLLNKGAYGDMRFFSEATFAKMLPIKLAPLVERPSTREYGMGCVWYPEDGLGENVLGHGAASSAALRICPQYDMVIVVCRNRGSGNQDKYQPRLFKAAVAGIEK